MSLIIPRAKAPDTHDFKAVILAFNACLAGGGVGALRARRGVRATDFTKA